MIDPLSVEFPVEELCKVLKVSRSGYYRWKKAVPSRRKKENQKLLVEMYLLKLDLTVVSYLTVRSVSCGCMDFLSNIFSSAKCLDSIKVCMGVLPKQNFPE